MPSSANALASVAAAVFLLAGSVASGQEKAEGKSAASETSEKPKEKKKKKPASDVLNVPVAEGHEAQGLRVPYFGENGKLQMYFNIEVAKRTDAQHLLMMKAEMQTFDETGEPEMTIELPESVLDLKTRVITSTSPVTIRREDFELTGEKMTFNTQTRRGKLTGNVKMLIFNRSELAGNKTEQ